MGLPSPNRKPLTAARHYVSSDHPFGVMHVAARPTRRGTTAGMTTPSRNVIQAQRYSIISLIGFT
jgi:hypothetical protein